MKVLFVIQGEGRGHLTQALAMAGMLRRNGHEIAEVLVGKSNFRTLPAFFSDGIKAPVKRFLSPNFLPSPSNRRVALLRSVWHNLFSLPEYMESIRFINRRIKESGADLVVNFYELLTGMAYLFYRQSVPQVCVAHQYLFLHPDFVFPEGKGEAGLFFLRLFTRLTSLGATERLALSFAPMRDVALRKIRVVPPLLRPEVLSCKAKSGDYIHGYMLNAGFSKDVMSWHRQNPDIPLHFFWDKADAGDEYRVDDRLTFHKINDSKFLSMLAGCRGYATTAGFESVCEAMYLGKPVLMVPAHIEQDCNACDAVRHGAGIVAEEFDLSRLSEFAGRYVPNTAFRRWVDGCGNAVMAVLEEVVYRRRYTATVPALRYGSYI